MNTDDLIDLITGGEDSFTQFKENLQDARRLAEEFVAFSNAEGGQLILGVSDDHRIKSLSPEDLNALNEAGEEASKKSRMVFLDNKKIRLQREINHLNETVNGGIVFITGGIQPGTAINVRRMRYNVLTPTTSMAYHFSQNGVQSAACETMIDDYRKYLLKLPA